MAKTEPKDLLRVLAFAIEHPLETLALLDQLEADRQAGSARVVLVRKRLRRDPSLAKELVMGFPRVDAPADRRPRPRRARGA